MNFYIADPHWGHKNNMAYDNRPFNSIEENDKALIDNWNSVVGMTDDVYILGDISWYNSTETIKIIKQLNGNKHLIRGNHDGKILKNPKLQELFVEITDYKEITFDDGSGLILCHYPILAFKNHYYKWIHLYGHVHSTWEYELIDNARLASIEISGKPCRMYNVGCMMSWIDYTPRTLTEILNACEQHNNNNDETSD